MEQGFGNMVGTDFEGVGASPGVARWRIVKRHLVAVEATDPMLSQGVLYEKDAVLCLETTPGPHWVVRTWTGKSAGMVVAGFVGSMANKLGNLLSSNGSARDLEVVHEKQGSESDGFKAIIGHSTLTYEAGEAPVKKKASQQDKQQGLGLRPNLWKMDQGALKRVRCHADSLEQDKAFVLDVQDGVARSWAGLKAMRVERAVCEELARRIAKHQYAEEDARAEHYRQNDDDADFLKAVRAYENRAESSMMTPSNEIKVMDAAMNVLASHEQSLPSETLTKNGGVKIVDAFGTEVYVWAAKGVPSSEIEAAKSKLLGFLKTEDVQIVKERFEPIVFKERFFGWPDSSELEIGNTMKRRDDAAKATKKTMTSVDAEVKSILGLSGPGAAKAQDEDPQPISAARDPDFTAKAYYVKEVHHLGINHPPTCSVEDLDVSDTQKPLRLESDKMYIIRVSWSQGRRHVVYTWEGADASTQSRSTAGIEVPKIASKLQGIEHQIYVRQNSEPPLLCQALSIASVVREEEKKGTTITECRDECCAQLGPGVFEGVYGNKLDPAFAYVVETDDGNTYSIAGAFASDASKKRAASLSNYKVAEPPAPYNDFDTDLHAYPSKVVAYSVAHARRLVGKGFVEVLASPLSQADILTQDVGGLVVATSDSVFVWYCEQTHDDDLKLACDFAARLEKTARTERNEPKRSITLQVAGRETSTFARLFRGFRKNCPGKQEKPWVTCFLADVIKKAENNEASPLDDHRFDDDAVAALEEKKNKIKLPEVHRSLSRSAKKKPTREMSIEERMGAKVERSKDGALVVKAGQAFKFDEEECHVQDVLTHLHDGAADFCVYAYHSKKILHLVHHGLGGIDELKNKLEPSNVNYGLLALTPAVLTQHFGQEVSHPIYVLIVWIPADGVSPLVKGAVNSHRSAVAQIFEPVHETINADSLDAIAPDKIWDAVQPHLH